MWKIYILNCEDGETTGDFESTIGGSELFIDWAMLALQYPAVCCQGVQYLVVTTEVATWFISEPIECR